MASYIYRYEVPVDDQWHTFDLAGNPLAVACRQVDVVEFWALAHSDDVAAYPVRRQFIVVGTGQPLPEDGLKYWGVGISNWLVWHLMERDPRNFVEEPS